MKLLTVDETAELLKVSRRHVDRMIKAGKLKATDGKIEVGTDLLQTPYLEDFNVCFYEAIAGILYGDKSLGSDFLRQVDDTASVYLVGAGEFIKIGASRDFKKRLMTIRGYCPLNLEVIAVAVGGFQTEAILHDHFRPYRLRRNAEWFRNEGSLRMFANMIRGAYKLCNS